MKNNFRTSLVAVLSCAGVFMILSLSFPSLAENPESPSEVSELLMLQADVFLKLQQAKLKQAEEFNKKVANTISPQDLKILRDNVELGKEVLEDARQGDMSGREAVYLRLAENTFLQAEADLAKATEVRQKVPSSFSSTDIELLQIKAEQAKIHLELGKLAFASTAENELRWKIDLLYNEFLKLRNDLKQSRISR